jgi:CRP-like cAMP-binding protein
LINIPTNKGMSVVKFKPGDHLIREKQPATHLYIIKEGQLEVYKIGKDGEKIPVALIGSGEYVGETAVLLNDNYNSNVVALTKVTALQLEKKYVEAQIKQVPAWLTALTIGLVDRLRRANEVLKKHGLIDESLNSRLKAIEDNAKKSA